MRLFPELGQELRLKLVGMEHYNGIVDMVCEKVREASCRAATAGLPVPENRTPPSET